MVVDDEMKDAEKETLNELRKRMKGEIDAEMYEDIYLFYRFLKVRDFNVDNAEIMLRKHLECREKYDIKNIFQYKLPEVFAKYFPYNLLGYDKEGCVVRYIPFGNIDTIGFPKCVKFEDIVKSCIYEMETDTAELKKQCERLDRNVDKCIYINNCENFSFAQATDKRSIYTLIFVVNIYQSNYPGRTKAIYLINASSYFSMFFSIVKPFLTKELAEKIHLYSDDSWKEDLLKVIDVDVLPAFLSGTRTDPDGNPLCLTFINHGYPIPETYYIDRSTKSLGKSPGVVKVTLRNATFHEVKIDVKEAGSHLEWEFETKCRDIGFGLFYEATVDGEEKVDEIKPIQRIDTTEFTETGTFKCENAGTYVIVFDNTYSWIRAKDIYYRLKIISPSEYETQLEKQTALLSLS